MRARSTAAGLAITVTVALLLINDMEKVDAEATTSQAAEVRVLHALSADYDATRDAFEAVLKRYADARAGFRTRLAASCDQMIANTTECRVAGAAVGRAGAAQYP